MEFSGPSFCQIHNGLPCHKWVITAHEKTPKGTKYDIYYFKDKGSAETYLEYLRQCYNLQETENKIKSRRTFLWEKQELIEFLKTIDTSFLINAVKNMKFDEEHIFYPAK